MKQKSQESYRKEFDRWNQVKKELKGRHEAQVPTIKEREIWWCSIGVNVGSEMDGKHYEQKYNRPVLVVKKCSKHTFLGVPLTSQLKSGKYACIIELKGKKQCLVLSQLRLYDTKRISSYATKPSRSYKPKMGTMPEEQFKAIKEALAEFIGT